jgi:hypothetical protein
MEHVHTFHSPKLWSSKEHRLIFETPETGGEVESTEIEAADADPNTLEVIEFNSEAEGVGGVERLIESLDEDQLRTLKEMIEARLSGEGDEDTALPVLPEDGDEPIEIVPVPLPGVIEEEEGPIVAVPLPGVIEEEDGPVVAPEPPVEEPVDPEIEVNVASETLDLVLGDRVDALNAALETNDFGGANTARLEMQTTLYDMVMNGTVNGGDINTWLEDKFPTFEVSYNEADMTVVIPALEDFSEEEEPPVEAPEPPVEAPEPPVEAPEPSVEEAPELSETMREILDGIAGQELDQVLRLDEMLDESNPESQLVMDQAIRELIQELAPQVDNGNISEDEINLWLREAFEGQQIPVYDHEAGTITVTDEVDPIEEEPTDIEPTPEDEPGNSEELPEDVSEALDAAALAQLNELVEALSADGTTDERIEEKRVNLDSALDALVADGTATEAQVNVWVGRAEFETGDNRKIVYENGNVDVRFEPAVDTPPADPTEQDEKPETLKEMIAEFFRELLKLLREGLAQAREQREKDANAPTTVTEAEAAVVEAEVAVTEVTEEAAVIVEEAEEAGAEVEPEKQTEIDERIAAVEEELARVTEERDQLLQMIIEQQTALDEWLYTNNDVQADVQVDPEAGLAGGVTATNYDEAFYAYILEMQESGEVETVEVDGGDLHIHFNITYVESQINGNVSNTTNNTSVDNRIDQSVNVEGVGNTVAVEQGGEQATVVETEQETIQVQAEEPVEEEPVDEEPIVEEEPIEEEPIIEEEPVEEEPIEEEVETDTTSSSDGDEFADL